MVGKVVLHLVHTRQNRLKRLVGTMRVDVANLGCERAVDIDQNVGPAGGFRDFQGEPLIFLVVNQGVFAGHNGSAVACIAG
jgi:hypothetical protein